MSVKVKTILLTAVTLLVMGAGLFFLSQDFLLGQFTRVEEVSHQKDVEQITKSVSRTYTELGNLATAWVARDGLARFLRGEDDTFVERNFPPNLYNDLSVDLIVLADARGDIRYARAFAPSVQALNDVAGAAAVFFKPGGAFGDMEHLLNPPQVLIQLDGQVYLATARAVRPVAESGVYSGSVLMGKRVDERLLANLRADSGVGSIVFFLPVNASETYRTLAPQVTADRDGYMQVLSHDDVYGYVILRGPEKQAAGILEARLGTQVTAESRLAIRYLLFGMLGIGAAALLANLLVSNFLLFRPLEQLTQRVRQATNLQEQIQTLADRPQGLQSLGEPLQAVLEKAQQAEQESIQRQTLYTHLFEQGHEGYAILDPSNLRILEANAEFASMLHWDRNLLPKMNFHALMGQWLDKETADRLWKVERDVAQGRARLREQEVNLRGLDKDIEISFSPIDAGENRYLYALIRDVTERKQLERSLKEQVRETTLLNQVIAVTTSNLDPAALFETVCRELAVNLGLPQSFLMVYNEGHTNLEVRAEYSSRHIPSSIGAVIPVTQNDMFESSEPLDEPFQVEVEPEAELTPELYELLKRREAISALLVPLVIREEKIGWLAVEDITEHLFDLDEVHLAQNMATAASRAYEVTVLYHDLQSELALRQQAEMVLDRRGRNLESLVDLLMDLLRLEDGAGLYEEVLPVLGELTQVDRISIIELFRTADDKPYLRGMASWTRDNATRPASPENLRLDGGLADFVETMRAEYYLSGSLAQMPEALRPMLEEQGAKSALILPYYKKEALAGFLGFYDFQAERNWDALEVALLQAASASISMTRQRIETGNALRDSEGRYRLVVENARDVIFQIDLTGRFTFLNPAWETVTGLKVENTVGLPFWKAAPEDMVQELGAAFRILRERVTDRYHQTIAIRNQAGKPVWLDGFFRIVPDSSGNGQMIAGTLVDISSYKRIELILRRNEEVLRSLYDITSSLSLSFEQKMYNLLQMGTETFELEGGYLAQVSDDQLKVLYHFPATQPEIGRIEIERTFARETMRANEPFGIEAVQASDWANHPAAVEGGIQAWLGTSVTVGKEPFGVLAFQQRQPHASAFSLAEKEFIRLMAQWIGGDMERERYTAQLKAFNEEIGRKSEELAVARDEALEASRLKSEFLATMSHEIRTPLNAVIGMTEMLLETPLNEEQNDFVKTVRESGRSLLTIINDILDFSKIEAGRMALELVEFDVIELVNSVVDMFAQMAQQKGISLFSIVPADIPAHLVGDPGRLRQILTNLVGNGVKFTEAGQVVVALGVTDRKDDYAELTIKVSDTGIGLSEVARKRLFNPFTQADGSTTRKYGGTGLGLVISKRLVELMGGEIGVDSVEDVGSTFWIRLGARVNEAESAAGRLDRPDLSGMRLLLVDSNVYLRQAVAAMLAARFGMQVDQVGSPEAAKTLLAAANGEAAALYQLALVDLPSLGADATAIKSLFPAWTRTGQPGLIFMGAPDLRAGVEGLLVGGRAAFLPRPYRQATLCDLVLQYHQQHDFGEVVRTVPASPADKRAAQQLNTHARSGAPGRILLAEDNLANQKLTVVQLKRLGYQTEVVVNGQQAMQAYLRGPDGYSMILMDCQMPIMDGFEATRNIRKAEESLNRHVPIVAMTANAMQGDREACLAVGMDDYISKPVSLENLRQVVSRVLEGDGRDSVDVQSEMPAADLYQPLDPTVLAGLRDLQDEGAPDFLAELIDIYLEDTRKLVVDLRTAVKVRDLNQARQSAHTMKGSSGNLGAHTFSKLNYEMELLARNGDQAGAEALLPRLLDEFERVDVALTREREIP